MTNRSRSRAKRRTATAVKEPPKYVLKLYVAGVTPRSRDAIQTVTAVCAEHLAGRYELEVIDLYQQPLLARGDQIIAAPTLLKKLPLPLRRLIGSMADRDRVIVGLDLRPRKQQG